MYIYIYIYVLAGCLSQTDYRLTEVQGDRVAHPVVVDLRPIMATYLVFCSCVMLRGMSFSNDLTCI